MKKCYIIYTHGKSYDYKKEEYKKTINEYTDLVNASFTLSSHSIHSASFYCRRQKSQIPKVGL